MPLTVTVNVTSEENANCSTAMAVPSAVFVAHLLAAWLQAPQHREQSRCDPREAAKKYENQQLML
jgi:hypothetical protein